MMRTRTLPLITLLIGSLTLPALAGDWPQWRGPDRTGLSEETGLLQAWPEGGPERLWLFENAGIGYSGFCVVDGRVYTMGGRNGTTDLFCLDAKTGKELWSTRMNPMLEDGWANGPRGTPTYSDGNIYALSGTGTVLCADAKTGKEVWRVDLLEDFDGRKGGWDYTESVLVDDGKVIVSPGGGQGTVLALDKKTGKQVWRSKDVRDSAEYASIIAIDHNGKRQYVKLTQKTLFGIDAQTGDVLWRTGWDGKTAVIPTPIFHDGHVYIASGYGVGCKLVKIGPDGQTTDVYENKVMKNHHGGVILLDGKLYGYSDGPGWVCQDFMTGEMIWNDKSLGKGAIAYADGRFYLLEENSGTVALIEASPEGYKEHGRFKPTPQAKERPPKGRVWTHPVIVNGKLFLRDQQYIYCYDVQANRAN